ncbi:hypothetical protein QAD02_021608 [Eretmocerus hayati]|uniref:Uncharacterized protein n=1 Tax=Eretmocerus hayati TaxID=131215 RepID=A0ACC2PVK1_9HYME|nr:hypothetical protein QAD02_021608 [Eretmocerus hayati]
MHYLIFIGSTLLNFPPGTGTPKRKKNRKSRGERRRRKLDRQNYNVQETKTRRMPSFWKQFQTGIISFLKEFPSIPEQHAEHGVREGRIFTEAIRELLTSRYGEEEERRWEKRFLSRAIDAEQHECWFDHGINRPQIRGVEHIFGDYLDALAVQQTQEQGRTLQQWLLSFAIDKLPFHGCCNECGREVPV